MGIEGRVVGKKDRRVEMEKIRRETSLHLFLSSLAHTNMIVYV